MKIVSGPAVFTVYGGKIYLFSNKATKAMFDKDHASMAAKADKNWLAVTLKPVTKMK